MIKAEKYGNYLLTRSKKINEKKIREEQKQGYKRKRSENNGKGGGNEVDSENESENYTRLEC